jgi:hypothetical protein
MSLKRSDKIIAVLGVVIMIAAGFGILLYASSDEDNGDTPIIDTKQDTYRVYYEESDPISATPDNTVFSIKPKFINQQDYTGNVVINQKNLKSVTIKVEYEDSFKGFILGIIGKLGADTLTVTIKDADGNTIETGSIKGDQKKNVTFTIDVGSLISLDSIEAEDIKEATDILEDRYVNYDKTYTIKASLKTGLWGKIRERLKTDSFYLMVTYTYYDYSLEEPDGNPPNDPDGNMPPIGANPVGIYTATNFALAKI